MFGPDRIEPRESAVDVAENEAGASCLDLGVDALVGEHEFHVFIVLNDDVGHTGAGGLKEAGRGIEMLVEEAAMNGFYPGKLTTVQIEILDVCLACHVLQSSPVSPMAGVPRSGLMPRIPGTPTSINRLAVQSPV